MTIDLHIHSNFSDGTFSPKEIVKMAKARGLSAISITDHDTAEGIDEALMAGREYGVKVIPGVELSIAHKGLNVHLLGYYFDHHDQVLLDKIKVVQKSRKDRNYKIIKKLNELNIKVSYGEVKAMTLTGQIGRPHIAKLLMKKGYVRSLDEAFAKYLGKGAKAYMKRFLYGSTEAIDIIHKSGGLAVLAHPVQVDPTYQQLPDVVKELTQAGLDGVEVYYPSHARKAKKMLNKLASQFDLIVTGGSDYHGTIRPRTSLAGGKTHVPTELLDKMHQRWIMKYSK